MLDCCANCGHTEVWLGCVQELRAQGERQRRDQVEPEGLGMVGEEVPHRLPLTQTATLRGGTTLRFRPLFSR